MLICEIWNSLPQAKTEKHDKNYEIRLGLYEKWGKRTNTLILHTPIRQKKIKWNKEFISGERLYHLTCKCYGFIQYVTKVGVITFEYFYCFALVYSSGSTLTAFIFFEKNYVQFLLQQYF